MYLCCIVDYSLKKCIIDTEIQGDKETTSPILFHSKFTKQKETKTKCEILTFDKIVPGLETFSTESVLFAELLSYNQMMFIVHNFYINIYDICSCSTTMYFLTLIILSEIAQFYIHVNLIFKFPSVSKSEKIMP